MAAAPKAPSLHDRAMKAYESLDFKSAAELFKQDLKAGSPDEQDSRQRLVLSLYQLGRKEDAVSEYHVLLQRFPAFHFDDNEVLPETISYFENRRPKVIKAAPDQPRKIETASATSKPIEAKRWRWYYLTPLGVGQFLAGSPVRGSVFAVLQAGLVAADVAMFVMFNNRVDANGQTAPDQLSSTRSLQTGMNVVFFAMIGSFVAGLVDGIFFEP